MKYNCTWIYSILPTRSELQITDRNTGEIVFDEAFPAMTVALSGMEKYDIEFIQQFVDVFNYKIYTNRSTKNYIGKGTYNAEV